MARKCQAITFGLIMALRCTASFEERKCERHQVHKGKHRSGGVTWTDAGVLRYYEDQRKAQEKAAKDSAK